MKPKSVIRLATAACIFGIHAQAATFTWNGASNSYNTANWDSNQPWTIENDAIIASGQVNVGDAGFLATSVTLNGGVLEIGHTNALQTTTLVLNANNALSFLANIGTFNAGSLAGSGNIALTDTAAAPVTLSVGANGTSTSYSGTFNGAGSLTKTGAGTLALSRGPGSSGNLSVTAGRLTVNGSSWTMNNNLLISGGTLEVNPGAIIQAGKTITFDAPGGGILRLGSGSNFYPVTWGSQQAISSAGGAQNQITGGLNGGINPNGNRLNFNVVRGTDPVSDLKMLGSLWNGGSLTKTGDGILELTAGSSLDGTTIISAGTLLLSASGRLGNGPVTNNAALVFNLSTDLTVANVISGSGTLSQAGTGTTIRLTGNNSYGTTTITSGTLMIGNNTTTGTLGSGAVTNNAALVFNRSNNTTVANTLTGSGSLTQSGSGTMTMNQGPGSTGDLTVTAGKLAINTNFGWAVNNNLRMSNGTLEINGWGDNPIQAGKTITFDAPGGGVLAIGSGVNFYPAAWASQPLSISSTGGTQNQITGNINANGNTLTFDVTRGPDPVSDLKMTGSITTGGSVRKIGTGILELSGSSSYNGTTQVVAGTLHLTGSTAASAVTVGGATASGTPTLTGTGTVNSTLNISAANGGAAGTINPGTAGTTGTLNARTTTISGSYTCDVISNRTDVLAVTGDLDLPAGATFALSTVTPTPGTYTIATFTGDLYGDFFTPDPALPPGTSLDYDTPGEIRLVIAGTTGYSTWATSNNVLLGENGDDDKDSIINLVEYALGLDPQAGNPAPGTFIGNTLTFNKGSEAKAALDLTYKIQTSPTLAAGSWTDAAATETTDHISFLLPPNQPGGKLFARLQVTKP